MNVVFYWHMHQPDYRDAFSERLILPWVRLHATRAYYDMAWMLEHHPQIACAVNFVPVLVEQLEAYVEHGARDVAWTLSRKAARLLTDEDRSFILRNFFSINAEVCIRPRPRYWHLLQKRGHTTPYRKTADFTDGELRDLQVLFNLAWFGFAARRELPFLDELERKGRGYTEDEKHRLLDLQIAVMRRVLPAWRRLAERGQVELTTTPYYHPILPLLIDSQVAEQARPGVTLPPRFRHPQDAAAQVAMAITAHERTFGHRPVGMWPAEGAISEAVVPLLADAGVEWIATDEAQLRRASGEAQLRRASGEAQLRPASGEAQLRPASGEAQLRRASGEEASNPHRPYLLEVDGRSLAVFFRDRGLSDALGFTYARNPARVSVDDLISRLEALPPDAETVSIILDGENPWEAFDDSGHDFLTLLYTRLSSHPTLRTMTPSAALRDARSGGRALDQLHSLQPGSWIGGNFDVWIGGAVENTAWRLLGEARDYVGRAAEGGQYASELIAECKAQLYKAEGSDWFWWYGETFTSDNDADFDHLFRSHLRRVYGLLGVAVPAALTRTLYPGASVPHAKAPSAFVRPNFGADTTYYDWLGAGIIELGGSTVSMYRSSTFFRRLRYGFDLDHLFLRLEPGTEDAHADALLAPLTLRVDITGHAHHHAEIALGEPSTARLCTIGADLSRQATESLPMIKIRRGVVELGISFRALNLAAGDSVHVSVYLLQDLIELDRYPAGRTLTVVVPDESFEDQNWTV